MADGNPTSTDLFGDTTIGRYTRAPRTKAGDTPLHREGLGEGKVCGRCKQFFPYSEFRWCTGRCGRKYRGSRCKPCQVLLLREWAVRVGKGRAKLSTLLSRYGITHHDYQAMLTAQGGACAVCGDTEMPTDPRTGEKYNLAIDHDHKTGRVRALLCPGCNNGLGCFKDDPGRLQAAISYLQKHI